MSTNVSSEDISGQHSSSLRVRHAGGLGERCRDRLIRSLHQHGMADVEISAPPLCYEYEYQTLLTPDAVKFIVGLVRQFDQQVEQVMRQRTLKKLQFEETRSLPEFQPQEIALAEKKTWQVAEVPPRLKDRRVDLGDISPANTELFKRALNSGACGIQTDLDDGHCPSWTNQLRGLFNVYQFVHGNLKGVPEMSKAPLVILRPRAWNMLEQNVMVGGKIIPGPLFDFGLHMFHNGRMMLNTGDGPFFYLPKLEGANEVRLWNNIFVWAQMRLGMPLGSIRACVMIESVLCLFELQQVLYEMRSHCMGLNCGMWDYSASFVSTFGRRREFVLPDRNKYLSMDKHYLKNYMDLVIKTCHERKCHATGGMAPVVLPRDNPHRKRQIIQNICKAKLKEIKGGADGFLLFDPDLVAPLLQVWKSTVSTVNQLHVARPDVAVTARDLLKLPEGGFTLEGLKNNVTVGVLFIEAWLRGEGIFVLNGAVEDSATAEISRSQIWQAVRHRCILEKDGRTVTRELVCELISQIRGVLIRGATNPASAGRLGLAAEILKELVLRRDFPQFITTHLYGDYRFINSQTDRRLTLSRL